MYDFLNRSIGIITISSPLHCLRNSSMYFSGADEQKHGSILRKVILRKISAQVQSASVSISYFTIYNFIIKQ